VVPRATAVGVNIAVWSAIEINTSISCSCIPALKPFAVKYFPKLLPSLLTRGRRTGVGAYGSGNLYAHQQGSVTRPAATRTGAKQKNDDDAAAAAATAITVAHTFEMSSVPVGSPLADGRENSRDGSEKALVVQNWKTDCYAMTNERHQQGLGQNPSPTRFYGDDSERESQ